MEEQSYWPRSQFDNEKLNWPPDESLLELDFRWPSLGLVKEYRDAREKLSGLVALGKELQWPAILAAFLKQRLQHGLGATPSSDFETVRWTLRKTGTLGAMLMHLKPTELVSLGVALTNARRNRTPYSTYPTSPFIARAAAHYVWSVLSGDHLPKSTRIHILDPTMEGGPFLLELAFLAPIAQRLRRSWTATQNVIELFGDVHGIEEVRPLERWQISWRWASKPLDCSTSGIVSGCRAGCCYSRKGSYWPPNSHSPVDGPCYWLGETGCRLALEDRPISCLMYPLVLNKANTWVMHFRGRRGCCAANVGRGPLLIDALFGPLVGLLGLAQASAVAQDVKSRRNPEIELSETLRRQWHVEQRLRAEKVVPKPRRNWL